MDWEPPIVHYEHYERCSYSSHDTRLNIVEEPSVLTSPKHDFYNAFPPNKSLVEFLLDA